MGTERIYRTLPPIVHTADVRPIGLIWKIFHNLILYLLLFFIKKLLNTDCHQTDYQTHERDKHYAENEADIETPSPDEITQAEMIHRVIIKIGPVFPHHDINHDANINEEKQSYYQDSLFFLGKWICYTFHGANIVFFFETRCCIPPQWCRIPTKKVSTLWGKETPSTYFL